jgi:response regulator NasT
MGSRKVIGQPSGSPIRILLADDDRVILATISEELTELGYEVRTASNGQQALEECKSSPPDLAILDIRMPILGGIDAARRIREECGVPVLFLSAYSDQTLVEAAVLEGALGYLVKPVNSEKLLPAITTALARARDLQAAEASRQRLVQGLSARREVDVAVGILLERFGLSSELAFEVLRRMARSRSLKLSEMASELVEQREGISAAHPIVRELLSTSEKRKRADSP